MALLFTLPPAVADLSQPMPSRPQRLRSASMTSPLLVFWPSSPVSSGAEALRQGVSALVAA
jgi:hypothetical protein